MIDKSFFFLILFIFYLLINSGCSNLTQKNDSEYLIGTWVQDSTNRTLIDGEHKVVKVVEYKADTSAVNYVLHLKRNKVYNYGPESFHIVDSLIKFEIIDYH